MTGDKFACFSYDPSGFKQTGDYMWNVIMTVTCLMSTANLDLHFEVNNQNKIQSVQVWNSDIAEFIPFVVNNQEVTSKNISFSATGRNSDLMSVSINTQDGMDYGSSTVKIGKLNEQTSCFIGNW